MPKIGEETTTDPDRAVEIAFDIELPGVKPHAEDGSDDRFNYVGSSRGKRLLRGPEAAIRELVRKNLVRLSGLTGFEAFRVDCYNDYVVSLMVFKTDYCIPVRVWRSASECFFIGSDEFMDSESASDPRVRVGITGQWEKPTHPPLAPADWQADPTGRHQHRYWDGSAWTDHVADDGQQSIDPVPLGLLAVPEVDGSSRFWLHARSLTIIGEREIARVFRVRLRHSAGTLGGDLFYRLECAECGTRSPTCSVLLIGEGGSSGGGPKFMCGCGHQLSASVWERHVVDDLDEFLFVVELYAHTPTARVDSDCLDGIALHIEEFEASEAGDG